MISIALYEDNKAHAERIVDRIEKWSAVTNTPITIKHYDTAYDVSMLYKYDCILLDVELPNKNGLEIARELRDRNYNNPVVFISSHINYSLAGYEVSALRFINKLDRRFEEKLYECMNAISAELDDRPIKYYSFKEYGKTESIPFSGILYFEASNHTIDIHSVSGVRSERKNLSVLAKELPDNFVLCSRSFIVNVMYIDAITSKYVRLKDGKVINITKQHIESVYQTYLAFH